MIARDELVAYLNDLLAIEQITTDKSNNGLQVEGAAEVSRVAFSVDGCQALYEQAADWDADFVFVHHGESWGPGWQYVTGRMATRLRTLLANGISLYGAHLPLDVHPTLGHNAQIAQSLALREPATFARYAGVDVGVYGKLPEPLSVAELGAKVNAILGTETAVIDFLEGPVSTIGVVSGAGASAIGECQALGIDCLLTGECGHTDYHIVRELGLALMTGGHYFTEVPGVVAVMDHLRDQFSLECRFISLPTGL